MADQSERIVLEVDDTRAVAATRRTDKGLSDVEKSAKRATAGIASTTEQAGDRIVRVMDRSSASINRIVANAERKAALFGKSGVEKVMAERDLVLRNVRGDEQAIARVTAAYDRMAGSVRKTDSAMGGMLGTLAKTYLGFHGLRLLFKTAIVDTALYAARTEQLGVALNAVAKANGVAIVTTRVLEGQLKSIGITTQESRKSLARLIAGGIDIEKTKELARAAQDLGRVAGVPSSEALERLVHAIITLQPELFRTLGLNVSLEQAYKKVARETNRNVDSLTDLEKRQIATNEALRAASAYAGVYAESLKTAGGQIFSMDRYVKEMKNAIGADFQAELFAVVKGLTALSKEGGEAGKEVATLLRLAVSPGWGAFREIFRFPEELEKFRKGLGRDIGRDAAEIRADQIRASAEKLRRDITAQAEAGAAERQKAEEKAAAERIKAEDRVAQHLRQAQLQEVAGLSRIYRERAQLLELYGKSEQAIRGINEATKLQVAAELKKIQEGRGAAVAQTVDTAAGDKRRFEEMIQFRNRTEDLRLQTLDAEYDADQENIRRRADLELRAIEALNGETVAGQLKTAAERLRIESDVLSKEAALQVEAIARREEREIESLNRMKNLRPDLASAIEQRINAVKLEAGREATDVERKWVYEIEAAKQEASLRSTRIMRDDNERVFMDLKRSAEGLFDAMITGSRSLGDALKRMLLASVLSPIKEIFSNTVAGGLARVMGGSGGGFSFGGGGGGLGSLASFGGLIPGLTGAPGGTPGFAGPVGSLGSGGGIGSLFGGGGLSGLGALLGSAGPIGAAALPAGAQTSATLAAMLTGVGGSTAAVGGAGAASGAGFFGGITGAGSGILGALAAVPVWGWLAIGGAIGGAFLWRKLRKSAEEKIRDKIRDAYSVDIREKPILQQIMAIAKEGYGGNVGLAIQSPQVRDIVQLYAMSTGQNFGGKATSPTPATLYQSGGSIYSAPTYYPQPITNMSAGGQGAGSAPVAVLDANATKEFWGAVVNEGIVRNPRAVQSASLRAQGQNYGRREAAARQLQPGLITA